MFICRLHVRTWCFIDLDQAPCERGLVKTFTSSSMRLRRVEKRQEVSTMCLDLPAPGTETIPGLYSRSGSFSRNLHRLCMYLQRYEYYLSSLWLIHTYIAHALVFASLSTHLTNILWEIFLTTCGAVCFFRSCKHSPGGRSSHWLGLTIGDFFLNQPPNILAAELNNPLM